MTFDLGFSIDNFIPTDENIDKVLQSGIDWGRSIDIDAEMKKCSYSNNFSTTGTGETAFITRVIQANGHPEKSPPRFRERSYEVCIRYEKRYDRKSNYLCSRRA